MATKRDNRRSKLVEAARFVGFNGWIVALLGVPVAFLMKSWATLVLCLLVFLVWQVVSVLVTGLYRARRSGTRTRLRCRISRWGGVYCGIALLFCLLSVQWGVNLFSLAAAFLVGGFLTSLLLALLSLTRLGAEWQLPDHVFAGESFPAALTVSNQRRWLGSFGLHVTSAGVDGTPPHGVHRIRRLPPGEERSVALRESLPERGRHRLPPVMMRSGYPFGLTEARLVAQWNEEVIVLPRLGRIHEEALVREKGSEARWMLQVRRKEQQGEFRSLREYQPGDDPRFIHWSTSARLHKLYVREFEQREMRSVLILLDTKPPAGSPGELQAWEERFETAVSFAATFGSLLTRRNIFFAFASYCPRLVRLPYRSGRSHLFEFLEELSVAAPSDEHSCRDLLGRIADGDEVDGGVCLVTPGPQSTSVASLDAPHVTIDVSHPDFDEIFSTGV